VSPDGPLVFPPSRFPEPLMGKPEENSAFFRREYNGIGGLSFVKKPTLTTYILLRFGGKMKFQMGIDSYIILYILQKCCAS
jgi:hypothetical protein